MFKKLIARQLAESCIDEWKKPQIAIEGKCKSCGKQASLSEKSLECPDCELITIIEKLLLDIGENFIPF